VLADKALCVTAKDSTLSERAVATTIWALMKAKINMGMKLKKKMMRKKATKKRMLPMAKPGGVTVSANVGRA